MTRDSKIVASDQPGAARLPKKPGTQKLMPFSSASEVLEADAMATSARGGCNETKTNARSIKKPGRRRNGDVADRAASRLHIAPDVFCVSLRKITFVKSELIQHRNMGPSPSTPIQFRRY
jgi:hypothetical protein